MQKNIRAYYRTHKVAPNSKWGNGVLQHLRVEKTHDFQYERQLGTGNARRVKCIDTGNEYSSVVEASNATGINVHHIYDNARGVRVDAGGMQWKYLEPPTRHIERMPESYRENKRGVNNGRAKPIRCVETGKTYGTCQALAEELGMRKSIVTRFMHNSKTHMGLHYEYVDKGEYLNGLNISESKKNSGED